MECRKQLCEKCKKKEDDYFLVTLYNTPYNTTIVPLPSKRTKKEPNTLKINVVILPPQKRCGGARFCKIILGNMHSNLLQFAH